MLKNENYLSFKNRLPVLFKIIANHDEVTNNNWVKNNNNGFKRLSLFFSFTFAFGLVLSLIKDQDSRVNNAGKYMAIISIFTLVPSFALYTCEESR